MQIYHLTQAGEAVRQQITAEPVSEKDIPNGAIFLLGYFDGVHLGHRALFEKAVSVSEKKRPIVVWTFELLPKASAEVGLITTLAEKLQIFRSLGADYVIFEDFDSIRSLTGEDFFNAKIADPFSPYTVICGENFRFGIGASCGHMELAGFAERREIRCLVLSLRQSSEDKPISSTVIRSLITEGKVREANLLLGYQYSVTSAVLHGKEIGRTIGHPTINQRMPKEKVIPAHGVYSCTVTFTKNGNTVTCGGVCNIGSRPTVNDDERDITLETYIFDFMGDLYGEVVTTRLYEMLRPEKHFDSVDELAVQIENDTENARKSLAKYNILGKTEKVL